MSYQNKRAKSKPEPKFSLGLLAPVIALLAIIPLITFMHDYDTHLGEFEWYTSYTEAVDFFLYYKMVWIIIACVYMLFCMVYLFFAEEKKPIWIKNLIPMAVYCGISLISAIASKHSYFSFHGIYEQFESVWVLIGYGIMVYYTFFIMHTESALKRTMNWFVAGITVMAALGLTQVFKHDFFRTSFGQSLMTPSSYDGGPLTFNFELGRPYLTLYNPNYVGFYAALVIPVLAALIFAVKKAWHRVGYAALIVSMLLILFASQSRAGIVALAVSFVIMFLCMRKVFIKNWKILAAAIVAVVAAFFAINAMNGNVLTDRLMNMFKTETEYHALKEIQTNDDNITVVYQSAERQAQEGDPTKEDSLVFHVTQDEAGNDVFKLTDGTGAEVPFSLNEDGVNYTINDARFPFTFCSSRSDTFNGFIVVIEGNNWYFTNLMKENDTTYYCMGGASALMKLAKIKDSDKIPYLESHYRLANMRGYIWARTIPLLKKYFFLGSGPDTFIIAFPNDDLVGMYNSGHVNEIITKPHCMYLQVGVQTGVISLIALLVFFGWYLISSLAIYWKNDYSTYSAFIGVSIFVSVIGYLILGLTNDSCVALSPIFYTLLGIGLGINHKLKLEAKETPKPAAAAASKKETKVSPKAEEKTTVKAESSAATVTEKTADKPANTKKSQRKKKKKR